MQHVHSSDSGSVYNYSSLQEIVQYFSEADFMPHGHCYLWKPGLVYTHVISDLLIGLAYASISFSLYALIKKIKLPFSTMVLSFGVFIGACGWTHLNEIWNLWFSDYWYSGGVKVVTAVASVSTGIWLVRIKPQIIAFAEAAKASEGHLKSLAESEKTIRSFFESAPMMMGIVDVNGENILHISDNQSAEAYFGGRPDSLIGEWLRHYRMAEATKKPVHFEFEDNLGTDIKHFSASVCFIGEGSHGLSRFSYIVTDITETRKAELAKLQASEERLRLALEAAKMGVYERDLISGQVIWSSGAKKILGYGPGKLDESFESFLERMNPEDRARFSNEAMKAVKEGRSVNISYRYHHPDGDTLWLHAYGKAVLDSDGKPLKAIGVLQDITDQMKSQEELKYQLQLTQTITDNAASCLFMMNKNGHPTYMNPAAKRTTGYDSIEDIQNKPLHYAVHWKRPDGSFYPMEECPIDNAQAELKAVQNQEEIFCRKDGTLFPVSFSVAPLEKNGEVVGSVLEFRDVTKEKEYEKSLQEALKARDEFLSIASHELNTPLTSLSLQTQTIKRSIKKNDPQAYSKERIDKMIDQNEKHVLRIARLVGDMLDIARIRTGNLSIEKEEFDLCELAKEVVERLSEQFKSAKVILDMHLCEGFTGRWDRLRVEQVIVNLLTNSLKYGEGRPVTFKITRFETTALISIQDQGLGIAKENQERVFNRFERAVSANEVSGLGLGLFISKEIVKRHGGRIWVESELGKGSTFNVELPFTTSEFI